MEKDKLKILIIDDSEEFIFLFKDLLTIHEIEVEANSDPLKALKLVDTSLFDLIITDYMMDTMDGITFSKKVRESKSNPRTKMILLTAKSLESKELLEVNKMGLVYVKKPIMPNDLYKKIMRTIRN